MAKAGDVGCIRLIADTAEIAGRGLGMIGAILNPGLIILGGRGALAGPLLIDPLTASYERHTLIKRQDVPEFAARPVRRRPIYAKRLAHGRGRAGIAAAWALGVMASERCAERAIRKRCAVRCRFDKSMEAQQMATTKLSDEAFFGGKSQGGGHGRR